jgi:hypothetical protein
MHPQDVPIGPVEPGQQQDVIAGSDAVEGGRESLGATGNSARAPRVTADVVSSG